MALTVTLTICSVYLAQSMNRCGLDKDRSYDAETTYTGIDGADSARE